MRWRFSSLERLLLPRMSTASRLIFSTRARGLSPACATPARHETRPTTARVRRDGLTASPPGRAQIVELLVLLGRVREIAHQSAAALEIGVAHEGVVVERRRLCILDLLQHEGTLVDRVGDAGADEDVLVDEEGRHGERVVD